MQTFPNYMAWRVLRLTLAVLAVLFVILFITHGMTRIHRVFENNLPFPVFLRLWGLSTPELLSFLLPVSVFIGCLTIFNSALCQQEIIVARSTGLSDLRLMVPMIALATGAVLIHLASNLWIEPTAHREISRTRHDKFFDLTGTWLKDGQFTSPMDRLTIHVGRSHENRMYDLFIHDSHGETDITYIAEQGQSIKWQGRPAFILHNGHMQRRDAEHGLSRLEFTRYVLALDPFIAGNDKDFDRPWHLPLSKLLWPDNPETLGKNRQKALLAEAHNRLASPFLSLALTLLALHTVLGAEINRLGYRKRISLASLAAALLIAGNLMAFSLAKRHIGFNWLQYGVTIGTILVLGVRMNRYRLKPLDGG